MEAEIIDILECGGSAGDGIYPRALTPFFERMKRLGRWGEIVRLCLKVLDLYPEDVRTRSILAEAYLSMGFVSLGEFEIKRIKDAIRTISERCDKQSRAFTQAGDAAALAEEDDSRLEEDAGIEMPDLATPTLAELYLSQGRRHEAIALYEKILASDPANLEARSRLAELKGEGAKPAREAGIKDPDEEAGRYMIAVLEQWLSRLRNASNA